MPNGLIYLDNSATSFPKPDSVHDAVQKSLREMPGSYGRAHNQVSLQIEKVFRETRESLSRKFGMTNPERVCFTYNCTDSLNLALAGILSFGDHVVSSVLEHNSVLRPLLYLKKTRSLSVTLLSPGKDGKIPVTSLKKCITPRTRLVVLSGMSNIQGIPQPLEQLGKTIKELNRETVFVVDAAQAAGHAQIHCERDNIDILCISAHKGLLAPTGLGILYVAPHITLRPGRLGGSAYAPTSEKIPQEYPEFIEAGTPNIPAVFGLHAALHFLESNPDLEMKVKNLCRNLVSGLESIQGVCLIFPEKNKPEYPPVSLYMPNIPGQDMADLLFENYNIIVRAGLVCAPLLHQFFGSQKTGVLRISPGFFNTENDINYFLDSFETCVKAL